MDGGKEKGIGVEEGVYKTTKLINSIAQIGLYWNSLCSIEKKYWKSHYSQWEAPQLLLDSGLFEYWTMFTKAFRKVDTVCHIE